ncbi:MAG TPA: HpcH/HpaI aldolase/citrate lyase family protein [Pseudonocardia sp.]
MTAEQMTALFERPPGRFDRGSGIELLSVALGATLYMPADRPALVADITKQAAAGVTSMVVCLEDAIADEQVAEAEDNLVQALSQLSRDVQNELPLLFVRVREAAQIRSLTQRLGEAAHVLDGFVLPKFTAASGTEYLLALDDAEREAGIALLAMPVIESGAVLYAETRVDELTRLRALLHRDRRRILAVRIGATDLCALYGLRRSPELSIYDIKVVSALIGDVVNLLGRTDGTGFTVSGPVWEYYGGPERIFKPQLRQSPFDEHDARSLRGELVSRAIDGLIREVLLDKANGLTGKTAIHPGHVAVINALSVVSAEEYRDAQDVVEAGRAGGVMASGHGNKMNEIRPHLTWARRTLLHANVFGVAADGVSFVDLLSASIPR